MSAPTARHETRALLRAHLAAASAYRHVTRHCVVCHRLLRLAMESGDGGGRKAPAGASDAPQTTAGRPRAGAGRDGGSERDRGGERAGERDGGPGGEPAGGERPATT
ncbi:DUF6274 family protein [Streptomyces sp. NPDC006267]|uniref:DUF6274 family protein n=1 Tax=Streptomyces sp. NPDC006267 TaxID=3157173 RepID=UPI0033BF3494